MKIKNKKALLFSKLAFVSTFAFFPIIPTIRHQLMNVDNAENNLLSNPLDSSLKADSSSNTSYLFDINTATPNKNSQKQYYTQNLSDGSYAILTTSTNGGTTAETISKFDLTGSNAGQNTWNKSKSQLKKTNSSTFAGDQNEIIGMQFSEGSISSNGYLYVLFKSTTTTKNKADSSSYFLSKLDWSNGDVLNTITLDKEYNFLHVTNQNKGELILFNLSNINTQFSSQAPTTKAAAAADNNSVIDGKSIKDSDFSSSTFANTNQNFSLTLPTEVETKSFPKNAYFKDSIFKNNNLYLLFQTDKISSGVLYSVLKVNFDSTGAITNNNINFSDVISYTASADDVQKLGNNNSYTVNIIDKGNGNDFSVIAKSKKATSSSKADEVTNDSILVSSFAINNYNFTTHRKDNYPKTDGFISLTRPYYQNSKIDGYLALDSTNKVVKLTHSLEPAGILKDFGGNGSTNNTVYNINTYAGSSDWFPQDKDGKIADFYDSLLMGELGASSSANVKELLVNYEFISSKNLSPKVKFMKVSDDTTTAASSFTTYLNNEKTYLDFINIHDYDRRFGQPKISSEFKSIQNNNGNYKVELEFKQTLREKTSSGSIQDTSTKVSLGKYTYNFINANSEILQNTDKSTISTILLNKLPSQVTIDDVKKQLLSIKNIDDWTYSIIPNDILGTLSITINVPYAWIEGKLESNYIFQFKFGNENEPFFKTNKLANYDSSVKLVNETYGTENSSQNDKDYLDTLKLKYGNILPSKVTKKEFLTDFVRLGNAFSTPLLINNGNVIPPNENDIEVTPIDNEGKALIKVTIPKIDDLTNVEYTFITAQVFKFNIYANNSTYFMFKSNKEVLETEIGNTGGATSQFKNVKPSQLLKLFDSADDATFANNLEKFMIFSNNFRNLLSQKVDNEKIIDVTFQANDLAKTFTVNVNFMFEIESLGSKIFSHTFTDFYQGNNSSTIESEESIFRFAEDTNIQSLKSKIPSEIKINDLQINGVFEYSGSASALEKEIKIKPINNAGALEVSVTFKNWIEKISDNTTQSGNKVIIPVKNFTKIYRGFRASLDPVDMIVWKSFDELEEQYRDNLLPSQVIREITQSTTSDMERLNFFAKMTQDLEIAINNAGDNALKLDMVPNDTTGTLDLYLRIYLNDKFLTFSTTISGFLTSDNNYQIIMEKNDSSIVEAFKQKLPSEITNEEISKLYSIPVGSWFEKDINVSFDDVKGTLEITVKILDEQGKVISSNKALYTDFATNIPQYKGTNWLIVAVSVLVPILLILIPILLIVFYFDKRKVKSLAIKLDKRINEQNKRKKQKLVNSIEDLIDNDDSK